MTNDSQSPAAGGRVKGWLAFIAGGVGIWLLGKSLDFLWESLRDPTRHFWEQLGDVPVQTAALASSGVGMDAALLSKLGAAVGAVAFACWLVLRVAKDHMRVRSGEVQRRFWMRANAVLAVLYVGICAFETLGADQMARGLRVYRQLHANIESVLPAMSAQEERNVRSQLAQMRTREDLEHLRERLKAKAKDAGMRYIEPYLPPIGHV